MTIHHAPMDGLVPGMWRITNLSNNDNKQKCKEADMFTNHLISDALWWWLCIFPSALQRHRAGGLDNCVTQGMVLVMMT